MYSEYDRLLGCFQVRYTTAMVIMSSERKPPSTPPSQVKINDTIGDFTAIAVSNSDDDRHLVQVTNERLNGRMPDSLEVKLWRTVLLWMVLFFSSLLCTPLLR